MKDDLLEILDNKIKYVANRINSVSKYTPSQNYKEELNYLWGEENAYKDMRQIIQTWWGE